MKIWLIEIQSSPFFITTLFTFWKMLTSAPGALVKDTLLFFIDSFYKKLTLFTRLKFVGVIMT
jgi:hypothetical protein